MPDDELLARCETSAEAKTGSGSVTPEENAYVRDSRNANAPRTYAESDGKRVLSDTIGEQHVAWAGQRLLSQNDEIARLRGDAEVARLRLAAASDEIELLREAIRRLAEQDATLSVQGGNVTVTMDATLTDAEREAVAYYVGTGGPDGVDATLSGLLERTK